MYILPIVWIFCLFNFSFRIKRNDKIEKFIIIADWVLCNTVKLFDNLHTINVECMCWMFPPSRKYSLRKWRSRREKCCCLLPKKKQVKNNWRSASCMFCWNFNFLTTFLLKISFYFDLKTSLTTFKHLQS